MKRRIIINKRSPSREKEIVVVELDALVLAKADVTLVVIQQ